MHIKITVLKEKKLDIEDTLRKENYSEQYILRFLKTYDLVCELVDTGICRTTNQLKAWFERFFEGFNRDKHLKGLDQLVHYLGHGTFEKLDQRPPWKRNPKFLALVPEYRELINSYEDSAKRRGLKPGTIRCIGSYGTCFLFELQQQGIDRIANIQESDILSYFESRTSHSFTYHQSIRSLFHENFNNKNTAIRKQCIRILDLIPKKKHIRKNIQYFTLEETETIRNALLSPETPFTYRDRAICIIAMYLGLRGSDISNLKMNSIDWDNNTISIVQQKTTDPLKVPLLPIVGNAIFNYIKRDRPKGISVPEIFIWRKQPYRKMKLTGYCLNPVLDYCKLRMQPGDRRGLHLFRHHLATSLLSNDVPVPVISTILGHSQPSTTQVYLNSDLLHLKELRNCV